MNSFLDKLELNEMTQKEYIVGFYSMSEQAYLNFEMILT